MLKQLTIFPLLLMLTAGCAGKGKAIETMRTGTRAGIFERVEKKQSPPPGYADLHISSSIKTHGKDAFFFNSCSHGSDDFTLLLNIDGQPLQLNGTKNDERLEPADKSDPETGSGCRYRFEATVRIKAGSHAVAVALPEDEVVVSRDISLKDGANYLTVKPAYRKSARSRRGGVPGEANFQGGVKELLLLIDGKQI